MDVTDGVIQSELVAASVRLVRIVFVGGGWSSPLKLRMPCPRPRASMGSFFAPKRSMRTPKTSRASQMPNVIRAREGVM